MMYFNWNEHTLRWYINAERHSGFYARLARDCRPMLEGFETLCDLGCGAALFDFAIAPYMASIDCVDINEAALSSVRARAQDLGLHNIRTRLADSDALTGGWDAAFMSFFGSRDLDRYLPLCKKLIAVVAAESDAPLFPRGPKKVDRNTLQNTSEYLDGKGIPYGLHLRTYEFGQPFTSREDARLFVETYAPYASPEEIDGFLAERLTETGDGDFPFYIPRSKSIGIFELEGDLSPR